MLKIAEYNTITGEKIDLKELEKYGFEKSHVGSPSFTRKLSNTEHTRGFILIKEEYQKNGLPIGDARLLDFVHIDSGLYSLEFDNMLSTLYNLIKDGLVEKVED